MKQITTATGEKIRFLLRGTKPYLFDPVKAIVVSDTDAALIEERLGLQITVGDIEDNQAKTIMTEQANESMQEETTEIEPTETGDQAAADAKAAEDKTAADAAQAESDAKAKSDADAAAAADAAGTNAAGSDAAGAAGDTAQ